MRGRSFPSRRRGMGGFGCCDAGVVAEGEVVADGVLLKGGG